MTDKSVVHIRKNIVFIGSGSHACRYLYKLISKKYYAFKTDMRHFCMPDTYSIYDNDNLMFADILSADCVVISIKERDLFQHTIHILQILEISRKVVICINTPFSSHKAKKREYIPFLSIRLAVPTIQLNKNIKKSASTIYDNIQSICDMDLPDGCNVRYPVVFESRISGIINEFADITDKKTARWMVIRLLEGNIFLIKQICNMFAFDYCTVASQIHNSRREILCEYPLVSISDIIQKSLLISADDIFGDIKNIISGI